MSGKFDFILQSPVTESMIEGSRYRCSKTGLSPKMAKLPDITEEDVERCKCHVSGHIHLMRKSSPEYYRSLSETLAAHRSCLIYLYKNFDVFGRYGNQALKDELKSINLRLGSTLSEERVGTNAAVMASRCPEGTWVIGDEHYIDALKPYACYAFPIHGRYERDGLIMLVTYKENLTAEIASLFKFIESTECIVTAGYVTEDIIIKDTMLKNEYSKKQTDNIMIIVDNNGLITYANDVYYDVFKSEPMHTINEELIKVVPEFSVVKKFVEEGQQLRKRKIEINRPNMTTCSYLLDCMIINSNDKKQLGALITAYKAKVERKTGSDGCQARYSFDDLLGVSDVFLQLKQFSERIAPTSSPVLIQGESGTGKELFAHAIHYASDRQDKPFVAINCAAIPRELIGSELFGYVGGSFTGANRAGAKGKFELADGGTLFLDEIGEMPLEMQSVLLRVLEDNEVTRVGGQKPIPVNVRLITATNRDLMANISAGTFRADLYYRLNVINLKMIPLRKRKEDIPLMAESFMSTYSSENGIHINGITTEALEALMDYDWPGNVRELRNTIERSVIVSESGYIGLEDLPVNISRIDVPREKEPAQEAEHTGTLKNRYTRERLEMARKLTKEFKGNKSKVAKEMGISRSTLYRILNREDE